MLNYAVLFVFAVNAFADVLCCDERDRSISYLDKAIDSIAKAKDSMPGCDEKKECRDIKATDCADWYERGYNKSGLYNIRPKNRITSNKSLDVFCDMDTDGGGWTVIQRRGNFGRPDDYFYKDWASYKIGFGDVNRDFWLGNDNIFALTNQKLSSIRFDMKGRDKKNAYAVYSDFWIDGESNRYMLHITNYSGNAGDSMMFHNNRNFTTKDQNNDVPIDYNCAVRYKSAWWYKLCYRVHLNGVYNVADYGITWDAWRNSSLTSLVWTEMKIRPKNFAVKLYS